MSDTPKIFTHGWNNYELIDAGGGKKLERWGDVITIRPEVQAYFRSGKPFEAWYAMAHWEFEQKGAQSGHWKSLKPAPREWSISYEDLVFQLRLTKFKHLGLFPEQRINWDFIQDRLSVDAKFLNLFAYTGAASLFARKAGAETLHVDSVKQLLSWARENMDLSDLTTIKWVHEDAIKFAKREVKRGKKYDGVIMDPPAWGIGAKNEKWKLEDKLHELMQNTASLLQPEGFLILNTYSPQVSVDYLEQLASRIFDKRTYEISELWMKTTTGKNLYYGNVVRVG